VTRIRPRMSGTAQIGRIARVRSIVLALALAATAGSAIALSPFGPFVGTACAGSGPHHASLVVEHGNLVTIQRCVAFSTATITGDQLLELSGIKYETQPFGFGKAVCQIDAEPPSFSACLPPSQEPYWAMFVSRDRRSWTLSDLGISSQTFADGDAEGFRYDPQTGAAAPPPIPTPCPSPTPVPTATLKPPSAATPRPTATLKPLSVATPRPPAGATPQPTPTTSPSLAAEATSALVSPSPVALVQAPAASDSAPPVGLAAPLAEPTDPAPTGELATAGAVFALGALVVVAIAAARSRSRRAGR
jgi:hypothetical protein